MEPIVMPVFLSIQKQLQDNTGLKHINEDTGQLLDEQPALSYPCALISITMDSIRSMSQNAQLGILSIGIKYVFAPLSSSSNRTPTKYKEKALGINEVTQAGHEALQGWAPEFIVDSNDILADVTGSLDRVRNVPNNTRKDLRIREVTYSLGVEDYSTIPVVEWIAVAPKIIGSFVFKPKP